MLMHVCIYKSDNVCMIIRVKKEQERIDREGIKRKSEI